MAIPNGYTVGENGAPGVQHHNYHITSQTDDSLSDPSSSSHLSFLYDRAQGSAYSQPQSPAKDAASSAAQYSPSSILNQGNNYSAPPGEHKTNDALQSLSRATPAPAYPYSTLQNRGTTYSNVTSPTNTESLACPAGSYSSDKWANSMQSHDHQLSTQNNPGALKGNEAYTDQMSNLRISSHNSTMMSSPAFEPSNNNHPQLRPYRSPGSQIQQGISHGYPNGNPNGNPAPSVARTMDRCPQKTIAVATGVLREPGRNYNHPPPSSVSSVSTTSDPRRNYIRQNIPWRDINAARKYSVPINLNRPRVQVTEEFSLDDQQVTNGSDHPLPSQSNLGQVDSSSVRQLLREGDEIGDYDESSIRYKGKTNPSKYFRLLQSATGCSDSESIERHKNERMQRRRQKREEMLAASTAEEKDALKDADDVVDISYVGSKIPSRTFRSLQEAIGARDQQAGYCPSPSNVYSFQNSFSSFPFDEPPSRSIKVVHLRPQKSLENLIGDF